MEFEIAYDAFLKFHESSRSGRSAERIDKGLGPAETLFVETVWWPAFGHFDGLHPEYEIHDFKDGNRYIDFAYIRPHFRMAIEIDGVGPHWRDISGEQFADHCDRQNHLEIDGWHVLRFAYSTVRTRPRKCQQTLQQLIGRLTSTSDMNGELRGLNVIDRDIVRLAMGLTRPMTVRDVIAHVNLGRNAAMRHLKYLREMRWLEPASGSTRIHSYRVHASRANIQI